MDMIDLRVDVLLIREVEVLGACRFHSRYMTFTETSLAVISSCSFKKSFSNKLNIALQRFYILRLI